MQTAILSTPHLPFWTVYYGTNIQCSSILITKTRIHNLGVKGSYQNIHQGSYESLTPPYLPNTCFFLRPSIELVLNILIKSREPILLSAQYLVLRR